MTIYIKLDNETTIRLKKTTSVGELKQQFCQRTNLSSKSVRLFFHGERLQDECTIDFLGDGDVVEAFKGCSGGGPPRKKTKPFNEKQIKDALNDSFEDSETELNAQEDALETDNNLSQRQDDENNGKVPTIDKNMNEVSDISFIDIGKIKETKLNDDLWLEELRVQNSNGELKGTSSLHVQLQFYLGLPSLAEAEKNIVKTTLERIKKHSEWKGEKIKIFPENKKKERKLKGPELKELNVRNLRSRREDSDDNKGSIVIDQETGIPEEAEHPTSQLSGGQEDDDESRNTPKQQTNIFRLFGIVSPFIRQKVPTEEELRRFSLAVHLWAEKIHGSVRFLQENQLNERHFKEILVFAGPSSQWKLIPDRSVTQYRNLWQNAVYGDTGTGFENERKLHDPSLPLCPFDHCKLDSGMIYSPLDQNYLMPPISTSQDKSSRRQLFASDISKSYKEQENTQESPTKEELKSQNKELLYEITELKSAKILKNEEKTKSDPNKVIIFAEPKIVKCNQPGCIKSFVTVCGLERHIKKLHSEIEDYKKSKQVCPFCGKETYYVDQHIKTAHKELKRNDTCEVCKQVVKKDMKKHRSICIFCPFCGYQNRKKDRLIRHIETIHRENLVQLEPMNLTSPRKENRDQAKCGIQQKKTENVKIAKEVEALDLTSTRKSEDNTCTDMQLEPLDLSPPGKEATKTSNHDKENSTAPLNMKREKYPFDHENEPYSSEFEDDDREVFTLERRKSKDELERELREIDKLEAKEVDGDKEVLQQFETFMRNKTNRSNDSEEYSSTVSTVGMYTRALKNDILPAFHNLFEPFDSRWLLDCTSPKYCKFEGKERCYMKPEEPIYLTAKIVKTALEMSKDKGGQQGGQRGTILNAAVQLMNFVEIFFNERLNVYGREPYESVMVYHQGVKTFISGTGAWKMCNDEKDKAQNEKKLRESYQHPNKDADVLKRYKTYINSRERLNNINKVLINSDNEEKRSSDREFAEDGKIVMGEICAASGCRPVVLLKLNNGSYVDKQPGFNPYNCSKDDRVVDEEDGADKIYRRVDPNLPPKNKACQHQLERNVAECPVKCPDRCEPDGYNLFITWDKTYGAKGPSYLHIPKELKHMMDIYDIKRIRYFKGRLSPFTKKEDWIHDDSTPFFLNSSCSPFKSLDLKHIKEAMGIDVTAYNFRKIVSTWAQSHASIEIRRAEEEALQHSLKVAKDKYMQNKQLQPQQLTQTYVEEENLFPLPVKEGIEKTASTVENKIKSTEAKRTKKRVQNLQNRKDAYTILKSENKPLGPKHRIVLTQRKRFLEVIQDVKSVNIGTSLTNLKPLEWRHFVVRAVCTAKGEQGRILKDLWKQMYQGDLKWGIRDVRLRAEEKNWPMHQVTSRRDRNSWIAASLRQGCISEKSKKSKSEEKESYNN